MNPFFFTVVFAIISCNVLLAEKAAESSTEEPDRFAAARTEAKRITVKIDGEEAKLQPQPLYTYDEKVRNWNQGTTWVWGGGGRPDVVLNLSTYRSTRYVEMASFSNRKIHVTSSQGETWTPKPNWKPQPVPSAPKPAKTRRARLIQMRALAKRFSARQFEPNGKSYALRLLSQPIHRYEKESSESLDGAFFALVRESDLEIILAIDAEKTEEDGAEYMFAYRPVSANKQEVLCDGEKVAGHERNELRGEKNPYRLIFERVENAE